VSVAQSPLLEPVRVGAWHLPNRVVMAPMTRSRAGGGDTPTALTALYYSQRASAGLIVAEASQISPEGQGYLRTPGIYSRAQIDGWQRVTQAVHQRGGTIVLQLWHVGRVSHPDNRLPQTRSVAPSALAPSIKVFTRNGLLPAPVPHELSRAEIESLAVEYAQAAHNALEAGFDGVELHAANGYLIDQFLHGSSNRRDDDFGGSATNRCRFLFEICDRVCDKIGAERVGVRLSPFGIFNGVSDNASEELFTTAISGLSQRRLAYLHVVNQEVSGDRSRAGAHTDVAAFARNLFSATLIATGGYSVESAETLLHCGGADLIGFGRPFISNPDLVERVRSRVAWTPSDRATYYTQGPAGYTDYPIASARSVASSEAGPPS
jgi:N-ethylmaleimide reductase